MADDQPKPADELVSIPLHPKHWVVIMAALEPLVEQARENVNDLRRRGIDHTTLPAPTITALAAPTIVRGIIVKELSDRGLMSDEANQRLGIDRINEEIRKYRRDV